MRNFRDLLLAGRFIGHAQLDRAREELRWLRRDPDDF